MFSILLKITKLLLYFLVSILYHQILLSSKKLINKETSVFQFFLFIFILLFIAISLGDKEILSLKSTFFKKLIML